MQLGESQGEDFVDLFVRLMSLRAKVNRFSGVPGGRIMSDDLPGRDLLVLIHELEHVKLLTQPLGLLLTALGLRVLDARNACAKWLNNMREDLNEVLDGAANSSDEQCIKFVEDLGKWYRCGVCTLMLEEVALPLLEGLAVYAEGSLEVTNITEGPGSFDLAIALEYQHLLSIKRADLPPFQERDRIIIYLQLWNCLKRRLDLARCQNAEGNAGYDAAQRLFMGPSKKAQGRETAKYFLGYLYVVRLLQTWRSTTRGSLSDSDLLFAANRFVGEAFALFAGNQFERAVRLNEIDDFLVKLCVYLFDALKFTDQDIDVLMHDDGVPVWDGRRLTTVGTGIAGVSTAVARSIVYFVFGKEDDLTPNATLDVLGAIDPAKNLQLASVQQVDIIGHDHGQDALLLQLPGSSDRFINFEVNPEALIKFHALLADRGMEVPLVDDSSPRADLPTAPVTAQLQTWLELWPAGIDPNASNVDYFLDLVKIRRILIVPGTATLNRNTPEDLVPDVAILDRDTPEDRGRSLRIRFSVLQELDRGVRDAIGNRWASLRTAAEYAMPFFADKPRLEFIRQLWENYEDPTPDVLARCHTIYASLLFPGLSSNLDTVVVEKMGLLFQELEAGGVQGEAAAKALWRFLKTAVWRPATAGAEQAPFAAAPTLDLIRATSLRILGIPLVRMGTCCWEFDLMPLDEAGDKTSQGASHE